MEWPSVEVDPKSKRKMQKHRDDLKSHSLPPATVLVLRCAVGWYVIGIEKSSRSDLRMMGQLCETDQIKMADSFVNQWLFQSAFNSNKLLNDKNMMVFIWPYTGGLPLQWVDLIHGPGLILYHIVNGCVMCIQIFIFYGRLYMCILVYESVNVFEKGYN